MDGGNPVDPLLYARALVLHDLTARGLAAAHEVSLVEEAVSQRRWWLAQWADGREFVTGLVAQDVQDTLFDESVRWPLCEACDGAPEHSLSIEPELGEDPHWVCSESGTFVAPLGALDPARVNEDPGL